MEFSIDDLNRIIMDLSNEPSVPSPTHVTSSTSTANIKQEPSSPNKEEEEEKTFPTANNVTDRQYYLFIFNNRTWSQRLQKRSTFQSKFGGYVLTTLRAFVTIK
jgi:hypothetical protein